MTNQTIEIKIRELEKLRQSARLWRMGATVAGVVVVLGGVAIMNSAVQGLFRPGPRQQEFVSQVSAGIQRDVVPEVQRLAVQTMTESRPLLETEITKLNGRLPDVTEAAMKEFDALQKNLPQRSEKVLDETFGNVLKSREAKIHAMFPKASDEQIQNVLNNLTEEGHARLTSINSKLFDPYMVQMEAINSDLIRIQKIEEPHTKNEIPTWQMGLLVFDIARADLKDVEMPMMPQARGSKATTTSASTQPASKTASGESKPKAAPAATAKGY